MIKLRTTRRALAITATTLALAGGSALATAGAASATAHPAPQARTASPKAPSCWSPINIGQPGNVYGWNGYYAGQVEQEYNTCDGTVWAHFQWDGWYAANYGGDNMTLVVSSPYGPGQNYGVYGGCYPYMKDCYGGGLWHGNPSPDAWRAGAQWNQNGCVAWGTLHWYGGADWSGPTATCGSWIAPS